MFGKVELYQTCSTIAFAQLRWYQIPHPFYPLLKGGIPAGDDENCGPLTPAGCLVGKLSPLASEVNFDLQGVIHGLAA